MDFVIVHGDQAVFDPSFAPAVVMAPPGVITGTARAKVSGRLACSEGDEASVVVAAAVYFTPSFPTPGVGTLTIESLGPEQKAQKAQSGDRPLILRGSTFRARFQVNAPATLPNPTGAVPDPTPVYNGTGRFITTNTRVRAE